MIKIKINDKDASLILQTRKWVHREIILSLTIMVKLAVQVKSSANDTLNEFSQTQQLISE